MKVIIPPILTAEKLCGAQKYDASADYRMTNHRVEARCDDGTLVFHTLTGEMILLENGDDESSKKALVEKWFLVPNKFDENEFSDKITGIAALLKPAPDHKNNFTILTTTDCNARCFYCYEHGRRRVSMDEQTATSAAEYMINACGGKKLKLFWFGGEPLYNIPAIDKITDILAERNIEFVSGMTSNGFYLTPDVAKKAKEKWKLNSVQITIDGTEKMYNRIKAYTDDCENPFERVLSNIDAALAAGIHVTIRLNTDKKNSSDISNVVDVVCQRYKEKKNCNVYVAILRSYKAKVSEFDSENELLGIYNDISEKIKSYGMQKKSRLARELKVNRCKADNDSCEIILPDGQLEKCHHYTEGEQIGSIYSPERDGKMINAWKEVKKDFPECADCAIYPLCRNLKKCDREKDECPSADRKIRTNDMREQMLEEYNKYTCAHA